MVPIGPGADGVMTFKMAGMFAETFDNLQVSSIRNQSSSMFQFQFLLKTVGFIAGKKNPADQNFYILFPLK